MSHYKKALVATNLPDKTSPQEVKTFFEQAGGVERILYRKATTDSVFVIFTDISLVGKAVSELSSKKLKDTFLTLRSAPDDTEAEITDLLAGADVLALVNQLKSLPKDQLDMLLAQLGATSPSTAQPVQSVQQPRLPTFSGDQQKGDVTYSQWRFHLRCLMQDPLFSPSVILQAIRLSVRGTAADVLMYMGEKSSPQDVLAKYDTIFGNALTSEQLLMKLVSAKQSQNEPVVTWSCRLQHIYSEVKEKSPFGSELETLLDSMLRAIFFHGLYNGDIITATRHKFEGSETYDQLLASVRKAEYEEANKPKGVKHAPQQQVADPFHSLEKKLDKVLDSLVTLERRVSRLEKDKNSLHCTRCFRGGHDVSQCYASKDIHGNRLN